MSAPNANGPNEGLVGQAINSVQNAANYTVAGKGKEASAEANKEQAKGNAGGSLGDRVQGGVNYLGDKADQKKHETSAEANKQSI